MAKVKKTALLDPETETVEAPVSKKASKVEKVAGMSEEEARSASENAGMPVPAAARPVEKVGNADVKNFKALSDEAYKGLNEAQKEDYHARRSKHELVTGPQTMFMIPLGPGEKVGSTETVSLNGYRLNVRKGAMVKIPVPMAQIIAEKYQIEMTAGSHMLLDRNEAVADALA